jgi:DNA-binding XRE family transcriptional regulator
MEHRLTLSGFWKTVSKIGRRLSLSSIYGSKGQFMAKPTRAYSRYGRDAALLLGQLIRLARIGRKLTHEQLAERAGVSRGLLHRIEKGDPGCAIGAVFEVAAIVGVRLFDADQSALATGIAANTATLALLPQSIRRSSKPVKDDF